ncbi:pyridoxal-phosphate dependent enzyme [Paraburkholderia aspalathi]|uniref:pyridoxal-phosphate dependent enzyme n=1 Tax=Paraburkholderia aspalathi TaxID=1324617 RepID=UPI0038BA4DC8
MDSIKHDAGHVRQFVLRTPLIRLPWLDTPDRTVWAKLECNQLTNSFKVRGAFNAIRKLPPGQSVHTASAGNHGLAVAHVARALGRTCVVYVPVNASELKLRRLIQHGASVESVGRDLHEAAIVARAQAIATDSAFISPFSHEDVILGQGSLALEVIEDMTEPIDTVIAPLGGGGLIAGMAPVLRMNRPQTRLIGVHPEVFQRNLSELGNAVLSKPVRPTLADGLAVQHDAVDAGLEIRVQAALAAVEVAGEADIERAVVALLHNESVLAEGAGAISLVPLLRDLDGQRLRGNIVVVISGGNIASTSVMKCFMTQAEDLRVAALLGHQSTRLVSETMRKVGCMDTEARSAPVSADPEATGMWSALLAGLQTEFNTLLDALHQHVEYVDHHRLDSQRYVARYVMDAVQQAIGRINDAQRMPQTEVDRRALYRLLIQEYSFLRNCLAWCSASSDQSRCVMFFDPQENSSSSVNYDRYGSMLLRGKEISLLRSLGFDATINDLLLVSSGQAAYGVIESFLLSGVLQPDTTVVTSPYIYFEALEQLQRLQHIRLRRARTWDPDALIDFVEQENARAVFLDPLANLGTLNVFDLRTLAEKLAGHDWSDRWFVIDGTMVSGGINVFSIFDGPGHPNILYYESGSKYLQLGLDLQMAGIVICRKTHADRLAIARRNTGAVMYQTSVCRFPDYSRHIFLNRMAILTRNAETLAQRLNNDRLLCEHLNVAYPDNWRDLGWAHGGGVVAVHLKQNGLNNHSCLDALIETLLENCRLANVALTKGVSFGFPTTRVSAAAAMADNMPPFLRFSLGEESQEEMATLSRVVANTLAGFVATGATLSI